MSLKKNLVVIKKKKKKKSGDDDDDARKKNKAIPLFEGKQQQQVKVKQGDDTAEVDKIMENGDDNTSGSGGNNTNSNIVLNTAH